MFIALLSFRGSFVSMANVSNFTTCIFLKSQLCIIRATLIDLNPDKYNQGLCHYSFMVQLDICKRKL